MQDIVKRNYKGIEYNIDKDNSTVYSTEKLIFKFEELTWVNAECKAQEAIDYYYFKNSKYNILPFKTLNIIKTTCDIHYKIDDKKIVMKERKFSDHIRTRDFVAVDDFPNIITEHGGWILHPGERCIYKNSDISKIEKLKHEKLTAELYYDEEIKLEKVQKNVWQELFRPTEENETLVSTVLKNSGYIELFDSKGNKVKTVPWNSNQKKIYL
jgi:hypothetical protein